MCAQERPGRSTRHASLILAAAACAVVGCSTDGHGGLDGDDDDGDDPSPDLPSIVQVGGNAEIVFARGVDDSIAITFSFGGHWAPASDSLSLEQGGLVGDSGAAGSGPFQLAIVAPFRWTSGTVPVEGEWTLTAGARGFPAHIVADADGAGSPGVAVSFVDDGFPSADTTLVWADLLNPAATAPSWIRDVSNGFRVLDLAVLHFRLSLGDLASASSRDEELEAAGAGGVTMTSTPYPGTGAAGSLNCCWDDRNPNGSVGPADDFRFVRQDWWCPGPEPTHGFLLSGSWTLEEYIENRDPTVAIGGGTAFAGLTWVEAREDGGAWSTTGERIETRGSGNVFAQGMR